MLSAAGLSVALDGTPVLHEVSFEAGAGGWLCLIGPNGAGKSTALRAVAGLVGYAGSITLGDADLRSLRGRARARAIAYVPQSPGLPADMLVSEYVLLGRTPHLGYLGGPGRGDRRLAAEAMEKLDVAQFAGRRLEQMSGGERQRVVLARALATEPAVLLLDEPTSMLDIGHQQQVLELVDELRRSAGLTVVSTLHDLTIAGQYPGPAGAGPGDGSRPGQRSAYRRVDQPRVRRARGGAHGTGRAADGVPGADRSGKALTSMAAKPLTSAIASP
jgi:iron complex transport system ATP-binding protein